MLLFQQLEEECPFHLVTLVVHSHCLANEHGVKWHARSNMFHVIEPTETNVMICVWLKRSTENENQSHCAWPFHITLPRTGRLCQRGCKNPFATMKHCHRGRVELLNGICAGVLCIRLIPLHGRKVSFHTSFK